jgi:uncharacterized metal-binding protein
MPKGAIHMRLDLKAIAYAIWAPFISWLVVVIIVAFGGHQPGVVCVTPVAWLLALWVGLRCVASSRSPLKSGRLLEAALAGGIFGMLQGVLFAVVVPFMGSIQPEEQQKATLMKVVMVVLGAIVSAVLSMAIGATQERRRTTK